MRPPPCGSCSTPRRRTGCWAQVLIHEEGANLGRHLCDHVDTERVTRIAHGRLGAMPAGQVEILCATCGTPLAVPR